MLSPLALVDVAYDFVGEKENRKRLFGKFSANDIPNKFSVSSAGQHKRKIRDKTRGIVHNCSDPTGTKKYALTEGPKREGINVGNSLSPPSHFLLATGLK